MARNGRKATKSIGTRGADSEVGDTGATGRWSSLVRRGGSLVGRFTETVREAAAGGLLKQALDARERGNLAASFWLLDEAYTKEPQDTEVASAFWDVAVAFEQPVSAVSAVSTLIRQHAMAEGAELAVQYWLELTDHVPEALADAAALVRIQPLLQQRAEDAEDDAERQRLRRAHRLALRAIVDERNEGFAPGMALRVAEAARRVDPVSALAAARMALDAGALHEAKRQRLIQIVGELDPDADLSVWASDQPHLEDPVVPNRSGAGTAELQVSNPSGPEAAEAQPRGPSDDSAKRDPARNHPLRTDSPPVKPLVDEELARLQARLPPPRPAAVVESSSPVDLGHLTPRYPDVKALPVDLSSQDDEGLRFDVSVGRSVRVAFDRIRGVAVAEVAGGAGSRRLVVDLLLDWRTEDARGSEPLRTLRMRFESPESMVAVPGSSSAEIAIRDFLADLLDRSGAIPLPGPDAALGFEVPCFDSIEEYEREVLGAAR